MLHLVDTKALKLEMIFAINTGHYVGYDADAS